jgi:hypothetical protein
LAGGLVPEGWNLALADVDTAVALIGPRLASSDYSELLAGLRPRIAFAVEQGALVADFQSQPRLKLEYIPGGTAEAADIWLEVGIESGVLTRPLSISFRRFAREHVILEKLLSRCLLGQRPYPPEDLSDIVFPASFWSWEQVREWTASENIHLREYGRKDDDRVLIVSLGLSLWCASHLREEQGCFELLVLTRAVSDVSLLATELAGWLDYAIRRQTPISRNEWLEYSEGVLPGTKLAGFAVQAPDFLPNRFPVLDRWATWNLLVGLTPAQLTDVKSTNRKVFNLPHQDTETAYR